MLDPSVHTGFNSDTDDIPPVVISVTLSIQKKPSNMPAVADTSTLWPEKQQ